MEFPEDFDFIKTKDSPAEARKEPAHTGWRTDPPLSREQHAAILEKKLNYGVRLQKRDVVIDIDPRNGGHESMLPFDVSKFPTVLTPSGGKHIYCTKPPDVKIHHTLKKYSGIEFKTEGRQVLGPGSIHPNGLKYIFEDIFPVEFTTDDARAIPEAFLEELTIVPPFHSNGDGVWTAEQLEAALSNLDPVEFADHDEWLSVMMASHEATAGAGKNEFLDWSRRDPKYFAHEKVIAARWDSLQSGKEGNVGAGTLRKKILQTGVNDLGFDTAVEHFEEFAKKNPSPPSDFLFLPGNFVTYPESGRSIFTALAATGKIFFRGGPVEHTATGLHVMNASVFRSRVDDCPGRKVMTKVQHKDGVVLKPSRCSDSDAKVLIVTREAEEILPPIRMVSKSPVIVPDVNDSRVLGPGYHPDGGGILVTGKTEPADVALQDAVSALLGLIQDFDFATPSDRSRAISGIITPALRMGSWFAGPAPIQSAEADVSQAGKTLLQKVVQAIYAEKSYDVTKKDGGVGSFDELLSTALLSGWPFVSFDNIRGLVDSQFLESLMTSPDRVAVRVPHRAAIITDCSAVTFQLTSNGIQATRDLANRCSLIRIRKRPADYVFHRSAETLLEYIAQHQGFYIGCVFAIVRAWAKAGRPSIRETRHDFRQWAGILGWIVTELFKIAPLMDGHEEAQFRISNPALNWLRSVCIAAKQHGKIGESISASVIVDLCEEDGIELPGFRPNGDSKQARQHAGKLLAQLFKSINQVCVEAFKVERTETEEYDVYRHNETVKRYVIHEEL